MKSNGSNAPKTILGSQGVPPLEIWRHIFQDVPWHSRRSITLVCQNFRWLAQPLLFENLVIKITRHNQDMLADRLKFITSSHIAPAVTVCWLLAVRDLRVQPKFKEMGLNALSRFPNLVSIYLNGFAITNSLLNAITGFQHLSELELLHTEQEADDSSPPQYSTPLQYLKLGTPFDGNTIDSTSAVLVHPTYTHTLVLSYSLPGFFQKLLDTGFVFALRSLTLRPGPAASPEFTGILNVCPALEELRFPAEQRTGTNRSYRTRYAFNEPPKSALSRLRVFQGPWYMVEAFTKDRAVAHLVIWGFDENEPDAIPMLVSQRGRYPVESLEVYIPTLTDTMVSALATMDIIRALSLVLETSREWKTIYSTVEGMNIPATLEYFSCRMFSHQPYTAKSLLPLFPKERFPRLCYLCDYSDRCYNPVTGDTTEEVIFEDWQRSTLGLYRPLINQYRRQTGRNF